MHLGMPGSETDPNTPFIQQRKKDRGPDLNTINIGTGRITSVRNTLKKRVYEVVGREH